MSGSKSRYIPALDGLRAFAVLAVIAYHMRMPWAPGGLLGVTVFFVLSGYLITSLLLIEYDDTGKIDLPHFWLRRIRRLVPAIVLVIVCTAVLCTLFNHALLTKMRPDVLPSLLFFNNWWQIFHDVSYFEALGAPSPLAHFWSLAIEEQFYLVWPVALFAALKLGAKKGTVRNAVLWRWRCCSTPPPTRAACTTAPTPAHSRCSSVHGWRSCGRRTCWAPKAACA